MAKCRGGWSLAKAGRSYWRNQLKPGQTKGERTGGLTDHPTVVGESNSATKKYPSLEYPTDSSLVLQSETSNIKE
eukprot:751951-Hanusia_phi.AAC.3